jgi:hypothetical protein
MLRLGPVRILDGGRVVKERGDARGSSARQLRLGFERFLTVKHRGGREGGATRWWVTSEGGGGGLPTKKEEGRHMPDDSIEESCHEEGGRTIGL